MSWTILSQELAIQKSHEAQAKLYLELLHADEETKLNTPTPPPYVSYLSIRQQEPKTATPVAPPTYTSYLSIRQATIDAERQQ